MYKLGVGPEEATRTAKALRGVINPIGGLPMLLRLLALGLVLLLQHLDLLLQHRNPGGRTDPLFAVWAPRLG